MQHDITESMNQAAAFMDRAQAAFLQYQHTTAGQRAELLERIAEHLENNRAKLIPLAQAESHLPEGRLNGELSRTTGQLKLFASLIREGSWIQAAIDPALPDRKPFPRTDIRKMLRPKGPVVVFGASNFPFAFSTMGGDTASALAAGCPVVIKAHPGHPGTSKAVFEAAVAAVEALGLPADTIQHVALDGYQIGIDLVQADATAAVGFTGSFQGGQALMQAASERQRPIEVFAEMSSTNPVVVLPDLLNSQPEQTAQKLAGSIALGVGQFCTNPGLIFIRKDQQFEQFQQALITALQTTPAAPMLHPGIVENYHNNLQIVLSQAGVQTLIEGSDEIKDLSITPSLASVTADSFIHNAALKTEVFGPFSLLIVAENQQELLAAIQSVDGQLTASIFGTQKDFTNNADLTSLLDIVSNFAGRVIFNEVPTGVEVCHAMVHGGPFPSTSNSSYTSVGTDAILRWVRPVCFQNFPDSLLPAALQNNNPLGIWRLISGQLTRDSL
ncbi:NADP-dependent aldehyde dehydrogenase [Arachidicoccus rhizosphaerae]|uniref:NADP-dependent aldehyde dehydrogenase n=1 Tax=Arachidicoccus rhizosphaerae TaxID=551991 RepID=A0A1H3ZST6_9BACT|nr:aldehyde dehydrogenase (NADP(+)) [Arachidicoccus rhizosphaerae]SEA26780.1 NADP-dependent aldehyde dehydrogenase [Arachidicoccus rhizosphaerae]